jgi:hypothetical protein
MIRSLERLKNTVNKYTRMADIRSDRLTTSQSERKSVVSRRPSVISSQYIMGTQITKFAKL